MLLRFRCSCEAPYVLGADRLDAVGDLLWREQLRAGYDAPADAVHPGGALEREQRRALELLLGAVELLARDELLLDLAELLGDDPHGLLHVAGGGADVGLYRAGVRVALMVGDGVGEPALLSRTSWKSRLLIPPPSTLFRAAIA